MSSSGLKQSRLLVAYRRYLASGDVRTIADELTRSYTTATLLRLLSSESAENRRAAALAIGIVGRDRALILPLGRRLRDPDRGVRLAADDALRALWWRPPHNVHEHLLSQIGHLNDGGRCAEAAVAAEQLLAWVDDLPEPHHQYAVALWGLGRREEAMEACRRAIRCCRYHYSSWIGLARGHLDLGQRRAALRCLSIACRICPDLEGVRLQARALRQSLRDRAGLG